jgi:predicted transcriptional regulator of viral defense system
MTPAEFFLTRPVFSTRDFALATGVNVDSAARSLKAYSKTDLITKVTRGIWMNRKHPKFSIYGLVPFLLGAEQGYVSFLSALHRHGVISQVPQKVFVATTGHTRRLSSPVSEFDFIQMNPRYMHLGVNWFLGSTQYGLAGPEKALIDCLYISTRKGRRFSRFPELDLDDIDKGEFLRLLNAHKFPQPISTKIRKRFDELIQ